MVGGGPRHSTGGEMTGELSTTHSVWGALLLAVVLAALHLLAPRIRKLPFVPETATGSFAGGLAVAYVFLHLLPELTEGNQAIGEALGDVVEPTPLLDLAIFAVALAGFTLFYGLERLADAHGDAPKPHAQRQSPRQAAPHARNPAPTGAADSSSAAAAAAMRGQPTTNAGVYALHLGSFLVYNALITYTMALRLRTGIDFALLFIVAMGLHFVLTDRGLEEHYPRRFNLRGRLALAAALLVGWVISAVSAPSSTIVVALLTALLGGSVLLNVFKEEIPSDRSSSFSWFLVGLTLYAVLLALVTAAAE